MEDIQSYPDFRNIEIQRVGIKDLHLPFYILEKEGGSQGVLANINLSVNLSQNFKGTHLSRFVEILNKWRKKCISSLELERILKETKEKLITKEANIYLKFKYFIKKQAPLSKSESILDYDCEFIGFLNKSNYRFVLGVSVPITALCPCSKVISRFGAHNQRGFIHARVEFSKGFLWIEDLVNLLEEQGSSPVYPLLKRADEKHLTERAYQNAKFVEDILRDAILVLRKNKKILWFQIECEDFESIHNHSTFAYQEEYLRRKNNLKKQ
ncbi:MAG: GTP cyclohydrolase I FolE2 [Armatimonadetes bacterium]|nr:GTP cyclohydrolase I FolE2 [Armatimonadota bacterium]